MLRRETVNARFATGMPRWAPPRAPTAENARPRRRTRCTGPRPTQGTRPLRSPRGAGTFRRPPGTDGGMPAVNDLKRSASRGARPDLMDPVTLSQLGGMEFIAREVVEGFLMGLHRSPHRGFSAEFAELRAYQAGDDLRYIDWRMFGRSDRYYVKQFEEETNLRAYLLVDVSESMGWSSAAGLPTKLWYAKHLAAALALILLRQGDAVGLTTFHDRVGVRLAPKAGHRQWHDLVRRLAPVEAEGTTAAQSALRDLAI